MSELGHEYTWCCPGRANRYIFESTPQSNSTQFSVCSVFGVSFPSGNDSVGKYWHFRKSVFSSCIAPAPHSSSSVQLQLRIAPAPYLVCPNIYMEYNQALFHEETSFPNHRSFHRSPSIAVQKGRVAVPFASGLSSSSLGVGVLQLSSPHFLEKWRHCCQNPYWR